MLSASRLIIIDFLSCMSCMSKSNCPRSFVAVNTYFENGLVMGYADCKYFPGLAETSKVVSMVSLALCQTHCKQVPVFSRLSKGD